MTAASASPRQSREVVPSSVLGMLVFIGAEVMFFMGLISAFTISRAGTRAATWSIPGSALPATATAFNTAALFVSGVLVYVTHRQLQQRSTASAGRTLLAAWVFGAMFVMLQGREWWQLLSQGVTLQSSRLGSFFYLIVGAHALHAIGALLALGLAWIRLKQERLTLSFFLGVQTFWYFVVAIWPIIYLRVYF